MTHNIPIDFDKKYILFNIGNDSYQFPTSQEITKEQLEGFILRMKLENKKFGEVWREFRKEFEK